MRRSFSIHESLRFGYKTVSSHLNYFLGLSVVFLLATLAIPWILQLIITILSRSLRDDTIEVFGGLIRLVYIAYSFVPLLAINHIFLKILSKKYPSYKELFKDHGLYLQYVVLSLLSNVLIVAGYVFFIIPGIILCVMLHFAPLSLVNERKGFLHALRASREMTKGVRFKVFLFLVVSGIVNSLGVLCLGVGYLFTFPLTGIANAYVYEKLSARKR